jgi:acetyltransferase-like isoleucine patch superfamily enzyme
VNGGCRVGRETFIGSNSSLREGITVGPQVTIASQSAVVCDLAGYRVYAGVPAREMGGETR